MLYVLLCYCDEATAPGAASTWGPLRYPRAEGMHRLMPTTAAVTLRRADGPVLDAAHAEAGEQLCAVLPLHAESNDAAIGIARDLLRALPFTACEVRPVLPDPGPERA